MNEGFDDFKVVRRISRLNLWIQIFLGVLLYAGLNFMSARHYVKWDFSENRRNSLSPESSAYLKNLREGVEIYVVIGGDAKATDTATVKRDLGLILRQYEYASTAKAPIKSRFINSDIENRRAETLVSRFGANLENSVIVACGKRYRRIPINDFYEFENGAPKMFKGERILSTAILNVSTGRESKIYFLRGHGELDFKSPSPSNGLSEFAAMLSARNYNVEGLDLNTSLRIPADAGMIIIAAPKTHLLPKEVDLIRKYLLKSNGRVMIFLGMGGLNGLEDVLYEWGIMSDDMLILDSSGDYEAAGGDLIARTFPSKPHPAVKYLIDYSLPVQFGSARPVRPDLGSPIDATLKSEPLILSGSTSWAEKSYYRGGAQKFDAVEDLHGPMPIAMMSTRSGGSELGLKIPGGKLVVFGDENFITNRRLERLGNSKLVLNAVNWMFDDAQTLNIPSRSITSHVVTVSKNDALSLLLRFAILPFSILAAGIVVSIIRRN